MSFLFPHLVLALPSTITPSQATHFPFPTSLPPPDPLIIFMTQGSMLLFSFTPFTIPPTSAPGLCAPTLLLLLLLRLLLLFFLPANLFVSSTPTPGPGPRTTFLYHIHLYVCTTQTQTKLTCMHAHTHSASPTVRLQIPPSIFHAHSAPVPPVLVDSSFHRQARDVMRREQAARRRPGGPAGTVTSYAIRKRAASTIGAFIAPCSTTLAAAMPTGHASDQHRCPWPVLVLALESQRRHHRST
ncbi:hypothetical protein DENSPDRAFT_650537 [Dentipellis sp. KUC8613]|nr:hypothetical protein DENSPDRAFT_650537 [Dentipellis sp. KUC8613]